MNRIYAYTIALLFAIIACCTYQPAGAGTGTPTASGLLSNYTSLAKIGTGAGGGPTWEGSSIIGALAPKISIRNFASIAAAVADSSTAGKTIVIDSPQTVSDNLTIPSDRYIEVVPGNIITVASGKTLIITGPFSSGSASPFAGPGKVVCPSIMQSFTGGTPVGGVTQDLPLATSSVVLNSYDDPPINNDRNFNLISQVWSGATPAASPTDNPSNIALAGSFTAHRGGNSGTALTALNPMISWEPSPKGTVDVSGTAVTWVSGSTFLTGTGWENANISINNAFYEIASVTDSTHLVLKTSGGTSTAATFKVGVNIGVEIDINAGEDAVASDVLGGTGLIVTSGGNGGAHHAARGLAISGAFGDSSLFRQNITMGPATDYLIISAPSSSAFPNMAAFDLSNGSTGSSVLRGGNPTLKLTGSPTNLLKIQPSTDGGGAVIYGVNAADTVVNWYITDAGLADFNGGVITPFLQNPGGNISIKGLPFYTDSTAALAGGLTDGMLYINTNGLQMVGAGAGTGTGSGSITLGTANGLSLSGSTLSLQTATDSVPGAMSAADHATLTTALQPAAIGTTVQGYNAGTLTAITDSTSTTSSTTAASATAVKSAYDLANSALPKSGGTMTGTLVAKGTTETVVAGGTCSTSYNYDPRNGTMLTLTLNGACAIGVASGSVPAGSSFTVFLTQSSTTTPTFSTTNITWAWPYGVAPSWSTTAGKYDTIACASPDGVKVVCNALIDAR